MTPVDATFVMTGAAAELSTVTGIPSETWKLPAASRATAVSTCTPSASDVVSQLHEKGPAVSSVPKFTPSICSCTLATPTLSVASACTDVVPLTVAASAGKSIDTAGTVVSDGTVTSACGGM